MKLSTVPLFLKTIHIPHSRTPVVSPYVVVMFSHCNEQYLNTEVRLTPLDSKPQTGTGRVFGSVCMYMYLQLL